LNHDRPLTYATCRLCAGELLPLLGVPGSRPVIKWKCRSREPESNSRPSTVLCARGGEVIRLSTGTLGRPGTRQRDGGSPLPDSGPPRQERGEIMVRHVLSIPGGDLRSSFCALLKKPVIDGESRRPAGREKHTEAELNCQGLL